jgi:hypothetical protein
MSGDTYQLLMAAFRIDQWAGEITPVTEETTDCRFFDPDELPAPLARTVIETLADLAAFERTGQLVLK